MKNIKIFIRILLGICLLCEIAIAQKANVKEMQKKNTPFDIYELKGKQEGATLLVIGGIHGDEPGGFFSPALLIDFYEIKKGKVLVVPNLNPDSILAFRRGIYKDMNRKFAEVKHDDPDFDNVQSIKKLITNEEVDFIINLHDGHGFYREKWENSIFNPKAWGQTYVIDQKTLDDVPFGDLDSIAKQIESKLNQRLHYDFHTFGVRNTETRIKDEEQQNSLTFFAITHLKPAIAIETSKNITELPLKTLYQLSSIEALMEILGIEFERKFELNLENVAQKINDFGSVKINNNIHLDLSDVRSAINFTPLLVKNNVFDFTHPLGRAKKTKQGYEIYIGHKKISLLKPDTFPMQCNLKEIEIELDGKTTKANFGETLDFQQNFLVRKKEGARVNVIGYAKKGVISEHNLLINQIEIDKRYSLDRAKSLFRVEIYQGKNFCGMINLRAKE
ncbi:M99 family carboxypeptidase catalytic domain-containing protein [uncultured Helicobacter sp.]|uniref:M99 family carboxypeptidase catalytic domain-containing protein n=1 Tax=uncultured Helicobacter sp. TaxID=175537 RepID=UPI0026397097|nr:M99 family carboxypeptidase catalytic domain-containing protein [uncultured Helicobacter sp.]